MSALPAKADMKWILAGDRSVPQADIAHRGKKTLFDHFVGDGKQRWRHGDAQRLRGFEIEDELKLCRLHDWQVGWLSPLQNPTGIDSDLPKRVHKSGAIAHQGAGCDLIAIEMATGMR